MRKGEKVAATVEGKSKRRTPLVDRFLFVVKVLLIGLVTIGFLAFIAQQISPDNCFGLLNGLRRTRFH